MGQQQHADALGQRRGSTAVAASGAWAEALDSLLFSSHPERMIGACRTLFAGFALFAIYIDPTHPTNYVTQTYTIFAIYFIYAVVVFLLTPKHILDLRIQIAMHAIDLVVLIVMVQLTDGLSSPLFAFLTFALLTATMRWSWRGGFATAVILEIVLITVTLTDTTVVTGTGDENLLIMRGGNLLITAAVLGYFGAIRDHSRRRLARLAAWPLQPTAGEEAPPLASSLRHAADVLDSGRLLVVWRDLENGGNRVAHWTGTECLFATLPDGAELPAAVQPMRAAFRSGVVNDADPAHPSRWLRSASPPLFDDAKPLSDGPAYWTTPFRSPHYSGTLYVLELRHHGEDMAALTEIVGVRIATELERYALTRQAAAAAKERERERFARDMHDSVLQDLAAANLQLKAAARQLPPQSAERLDLVSGLLVDQQQRIRTFVENLRPTPMAFSTPLFDQISAFARALERQWQCTLEVRIEPRDLRVDGRIAAEVCQLISEGMANSVRHGGASRVAVAITRGGDSLQIAIEDNGRGAVQASQPQGRQPFSLAERVKDLGGSFAWSDTGSGVCVALEVPMRGRAR